MKNPRSAPAALAILLASSAIARAEPLPTYGARLEGFDYPYPVKTFAFDSQAQPLEMAYLDVAPAMPNGRTVVLLHGKNFCAATWESAIAALAGAGYRVVVPDQVGFCKSSKPPRYQYSFGQLAANTHDLLARLGIPRAVIVGHSMGGMLAARYALQYPEATERLVLVNPIGLEDWKAEGVPWRSIDAWNTREMKTSFDSIRDYQRTVYYSGDWKQAYERWVRMLGGMYAGEGREAVAWSQALTSGHGVQPARRVRIPPHRGADHVVHRPEGPHRHRQGSGAVGGGETARRLPGAGQARGRGDSRRDPGGVRRAWPLTAGRGSRTLQCRPARRIALKRRKVGTTRAR